jgi:peptidoglycan/xylan/chitin deacetylase (PgdA/CDA1 family)
MYHGFGRRRPEADPHNLFVPAPDLEHQLDRICRYLRPLTLDEFLQGLGRRRWPGRSVLVTIDDGYESTLEIAAPMLSSRGIPAVVFICAGLLGGTSRWMDEMPGEPLLDAEGVRALADYGIEVGSHGLDHTLLPGLPEDELRAQVWGSAEMLADVTGYRPRVFAYPEGKIDEAAVRAARDAGYEAAFSVTEQAGRFGITRRGVTALDSMTMFTARLLPGFEKVERLSVGSPKVRRLAAKALRQRPR